KTAVTTDNALFTLNGLGWDGSVYAVNSQLALTAGETWGGSAHGSYIAFRTTALASTTMNEVVRVTPAGGLAVGLTTDTTVGVVNAGVGYRVNSAATTGNVLRGNGTNFVSAQLAAADLSNGVTGSGSVVLATSPTLVTPTLG